MKKFDWQLCVLLLNEIDNKPEELEKKLKQQAYENDRTYFDCLDVLVSYKYVNKVSTYSYELTLKGQELHSIINSKYLYPKFEEFIKVLDIKLFPSFVDVILPIFLKEEIKKFYDKKN